MVSKERSGRDVKKKKRLKEREKGQDHIED